jgi:branched-chain amino acid transport system substrate-binding protein
MEAAMRKAILLFASILVIVVVVVFLVPRQTAAPSEIRVGLLSELTGEAAAWGKDLKEGIDLAVEQVNLAGGINGKRLQVFVEDDQGKARVGVNAVMKLISQDRIEVLLGVAVSTVANAILPTLKERRIIFISGGASSPILTGASPYFFRTWPSDLEEALVAARYLREVDMIDRVAIIHANDDYGVGLAKPFEAEFGRLGGVIAKVISFEKGAGDFRPQVVIAKAAEAQMFFLAGTPRDMAHVLKQLREGGVGTPVFSVSGVREQEVLQIAGEAAEGLRFVDSSFDPASSRPKTRAFVETFRKRFAKEPGVLAASGYDSVLVLAEAIRTSGSTDGDSLRKAILALKDFPGVVGPISFTDDGNVHRPVRISAVRGGAFVGR